MARKNNQNLCWAKTNKIGSQNKLASARHRHSSVSHNPDWVKY